ERRQASSRITPRILNQEKRDERYYETSCPAGHRWRRCRDSRSAALGLLPQWQRYGPRRRRTHAAALRHLVLGSGRHRKDFRAEDDGRELRFARGDRGDQAGAAAYKSAYELQRVSRRL